jgi:hypothetical protein
MLFKKITIRLNQTPFQNQQVIKGLSYYFPQALANRLRPVLPFIISDTQKGFMKDRLMGENTRLLYDLMHYLEENNKTGLLLLVDFEAEAILISVFKRLIGRQLPIYCLSFPSFGMQVITL